ncbi:class I SAM-dependent methyltransferase [Kitasatospora purpeofusca]|uniref:Class I SAM-dependent methyltransferase n=1 Tax=Kitasatospora purpeofusca TaxID=67352 RepID=A0ABZ1U8F7_9ACTN|nr:class I SAM-dependent methyltransferase [Kitasatospora purpeofusca]
MGQSNEQYGDRMFTHLTQGERARLDHLADAVSQYTYRDLAELGVPAGERLLDLGGGTGVVAQRLAEMRPGTEIVCVDRSVALMSEGTGYTPLEADVCDRTTWDRLGSFGLVHARNLLMHLRKRDFVFERMMEAVVPGGWLMVADMVDAPELRRSLRFRETFAQLRSYMEAELGTSMTCATTYAQRMHDAGMTDVGVSYDCLIVGPDKPGAAFMARTLRHLWPDIVSKGYAKPDGADEAIAYLEGGQHWDSAIAFVTAWGRKG